jgi:hypothetical protein
MEAFEDATGLPGLFVLLLNPLEFCCNDGFQSFVLCESEDIINLPRLAPARDIVTTKARIPAHNNFRLGPCGADLRGDTLQFFYGTFEGIDIARPQSSPE